MVFSGKYKSVTKIIVPIPLMAVARREVKAAAAAGSKLAPATKARIRPFKKSVNSLTKTPDDTATVTNRVYRGKIGVKPYIQSELLKRLRRYLEIR